MHDIRHHTSAVSSSLCRTVWHAVGALYRSFTLLITNRLQLRPQVLRMNAWQCDSMLPTWSIERETFNQVSAPIGSVAIGSLKLLIE
jgi:hypothetical protein